MKRILLALCALFCINMAWGATLLPNGKQQFANGNGTPLARGTVYFYVPGTTTPKATWQDPDQTIVNTNPILLDGNGYATIYGSGAYRQIVKDAFGNTIWDSLTADTSANGPQWAGLSSGTANAQSVTVGAFTATDGQSIAFVAGFSNNAATTLAVNGTVYGVYKDGAGGPLALSGGEIVAQDVSSVIYDQTLGGFHLITFPQQGALSQLQVAITAGTITDLGSTGSANVLVNGTTTVSGFGSSASLNQPFYRVSFSSALTLTNSAALILPGGQNLQLAQNTTLTAQFLGSGTWQVVQLQQGSDPGAVPGEVRAFAMNTCPGGYIEGNGGAVSRTLYPGLFANLGITWGLGDGSSTFNLPDFRGQFLRGWDNGAGVDPGRVFAANQNFATQDHTHVVQVLQSSGGGAGVGFVAGPPNGGNAPVLSNGMASGNVGTETRPTNKTVIFCVKY